MAINGKYKEVAIGVAQAAVGGVMFGFGMQYIFTSGMVPATDWIPGITNNVVVALVLGTAGFALTTIRPNLGGSKMLTNIIKFGSAAIIGMGLAAQMGFSTGLRATAPMRTFSTPMMPRTIMPPQMQPSNGMVGAKII